MKRRSLLLPLVVLAACALTGCEESEAFMVGMIPAGLWIGLLLAAAVALLGSVASALTTLLYLAGRPGNDDQIARDTYLARRDAAARGEADVEG